MSGEKIEPTQLSYADFLAPFTVVGKAGHLRVTGRLHYLKFVYVEPESLRPGGRTQPFTAVKIKLDGYKFTFLPVGGIELYRGDGP